MYIKVALLSVIMVGSLRCSQVQTASQSKVPQSVLADVPGWQSLPGPLRRMIAQYCGVLKEIDPAAMLQNTGFAPEDGEFFGWILNSKTIRFDIWYEKLKLNKVARCSIVVTRNSMSEGWHVSTQFKQAYPESQNFESLKLWRQSQNKDATRAQYRPFGSFSNEDCEIEVTTLPNNRYRLEVATVLDYLLDNLRKKTIDSEAKNENAISSAATTTSDSSLSLGASSSVQSAGGSSQNEMPSLWAQGLARLAGATQQQQQQPSHSRALPIHQPSSQAAAWRRFINKNQKQVKPKKAKRGKSQKTYQAQTRSSSQQQQQ